MTRFKLLSRILLGGTMLAAGISGLASAEPASFSSSARMPMAGAEAMTNMSTAPLPSRGTKAEMPARGKAPARALDGDAVMKAMRATMHSRDGKDTTIEAPAGLRELLMNPSRKSSFKLEGQMGKLVQIKDTTQYPYTAMGLLADGCPGVLVGKKYVLTAGYCAWDQKNGKWFDKLDFFPGYNGDKAPFGSAKWKNVWAPEGYTKDKNGDFNFALIELEDEIGDKAGWMGFSHFPQFSFTELTLTSYPYQGVAQFTAWQTTCKVTSVQDAYFFYQCPGKYDTVSAMGGGPMWFKGQGDNDWYVTGVHIGTVDDKKSHWAVRLNEANAKLILAWMGAGDQNQDQETTDNQDNNNQGQAQCTCEDKGNTDTGDDNSNNDHIIKPTIPKSTIQP